jgi:hypothetical protein
MLVFGSTHRLEQLERQINNWELYLNSLQCIKMLLTYYCKPVHMGLLLNKLSLSESVFSEISSDTALAWVIFQYQLIVLFRYNRRAVGR